MWEMEGPEGEWGKWKVWIDESSLKMKLEISAVESSGIGYRDIVISCVELEKIHVHE